MGQEILFSIDNCQPYQVFRLKAEGYKTTQMREVLYDHAWFVPKSLQSSAFSLSTWVVTKWLKLEPVAHTEGVHALSAVERQRISGSVLAPLGITVMVGFSLPLMV
jgi:hypothetical protein